MTEHHNRQLTPSDGSWGRQLASLERVPLDIVHLVADHSSLKDLVALSAVSKPLQDLLSDPGIWKRLYKRVALLLPPGPYDWQSASYLISVLLRAKKFHSVWPSSSSCPEILQTRSVSFGGDATFSVLLGRWLLVAEGSTLVCYDSQCSNIPESAKTLFDAGAHHRILRVFSVGSVREDGIVAFVVLLFKDSFTVANVLIERGKPSEIETVFTSTPIVVEGWTGLVGVRLYGRLLVIKIGECSSDWESSGRLVIMNIDTLHRYHIPVVSDDAAFDPRHTVTLFFATTTHLIKVIESSYGHKVLFKMVCFPIPAAHVTPECDVLYPSHQSRVIVGPKLRECVVIHESLRDSETGKMTFTLCGLNDFPDGNRLEIVEVCLEPEGGISFTAFRLTEYLVTTFCIGLCRQHACGIALRLNKQPLIFALDYQDLGSFSFKYSILDHRFIGSELLVLDTFEGTAFFSRRTRDDTSVEVVDFIRDAQKVKGCPLFPQLVHVVDSQSKMMCSCGECYLTRQMVDS